jgi:hypothetical protein
MDKPIWTIMAALFEVKSGAMRPQAAFGGVHLAC